MITLANQIAITKGYFKGAGITAVVDDLDTSADVIALLAAGQFQIIEGGLAAGYFNALAKKFPIIIASDRVSAPNNHKLVVRSDLKAEIRSPANLKGRVVASNGGPGAITTYEIGKIVASGGLSLKDIDLKVIPFPQMVIALTNKSVDAAIVISPFYAPIFERGVGFELIDPEAVIKKGPFSSAQVFIDTYRAAKNPHVVKDCFVACMRRRHSHEHRRRELPRSKIDPPYPQGSLATRLADSARHPGHRAAFERRQKSVAQR